MSTEQRVRAIRGATTVAHDDAREIESATAELLREMMSRNGVEIDDIISLVLTTTDDVTAEFPAVAARVIGIGHVPLLCAQEIQVPGSVEHCIRVLMHLYTERDYASLRHVYLGEASHLRTDLPS
jgi:chorismate mutase